MVTYLFEYFHLKFDICVSSDMIFFESMNHIKPYNTYCSLEFIWSK